jgi:probable HAF family extracellular repeat protein
MSAIVRLGLVVILGGVALGERATGQSAGYVIAGVTVTDLGTLGGTESLAQDINDRGWIVGWSRDAAGLRRAFVHRGAGLENIGAGFGTLESTARGINRWGSVVGSFIQDLGGALLFKPFHWNGAPTLLEHEPRIGSPAACHGIGLANAISDTETIVGTIGETPRPGHPPSACGDNDAARWLGESADAFRFGFPTSASDATDVNDAGTIIGHAADLPSQHFRIRGAVVDQVPTPLTGPGLTYDVPALLGGLNDRGTIVGSRVARILGADGVWVAKRHLFVWDGVSANAVDLGALPSGRWAEGHDVNNGGFIAGTGETITPSPLPGGPTSFRHAVGFLYHLSFGKRILPRLAASAPSGSCAAVALNELNVQSGLVQVVGFCQTTSGLQRAVRWDVRLTPRQ